MKNSTIFLLISLILLVFMNSCNFVLDDGQETTSERRLLFTTNIDGTDQASFPNGLSGAQGMVIPMNDSQSFVLYNENLYIINAVTKEVRTYLTDISIDHDSYYDGIRELSISYDDRYIAFTSNHQIYLFDIDSESHTRISSGCIDEYPEFGIDNRIYFSRYDSENDRYKLMRMEIDGTDKQNLCECSLFISHIFPGQADSNIVYFIGNKKRFCRFCIEESELTVLFTHPVEMKPISKSNNDRYFSFGGDQKSYYLYDTELNSIEAYLTPPEWGKLILRMLPTEKVAVTIPIAGQAILRLLDIENGMQIGDEIIIENTANSAESAFAISPNGEKIAFIHQEK